MSLIEIGDRRFRIYVHRGYDLDGCQALRLEKNFLSLLFARMKRFKWKFGKRYALDGREKVHGEK